MVAYTGIQGQNILIVSSDPANPTEGQIWYNSTSNLLKGYANVVTNAWASGGNLNTARYFGGGAGTQTATLAYGGETTPGANTTASESYNGTSWTSTPSMSTARNGIGGIGTQTAALGAGGWIGPPPANPSSNLVESYNGSSWTSAPTLATVARAMGAAGTQTAAIIAGGFQFPGTTIATTQLYNGTSWTNSPGNLNTARYGLVVTGNPTAAIGFGSNGPPGNQTESWNGSAWTNVNNMNTGRSLLMGSGNQTSSIGFGGQTTVSVADTEIWNGTSWTTTTSMSTARDRAQYSSGATSASTLGAGGVAPPGTGLSATEEWTGTAVAVRTITTS